MKLSATHMREVLRFSLTVNENENPFMVTGRTIDARAEKSSRLQLLLESLGRIPLLSVIGQSFLENALESILVHLPDYYNEKKFSKNSSYYTFPIFSYLVVAPF